MPSVVQWPSSSLAEWPYNSDLNTQCQQTANAVAIADIEGFGFSP
ncbi:MAG: hypothetical protein GPOALKHO_001635 [Sodalis sp.]|nr:MAG: hypothetical protein GPOALKHO_001635 [Sodalis sp.]